MPRQEDETTQRFLVEDPDILKGKRDRWTLTMLAGPHPGKVLSAEGDTVILGRGENATVQIEDRGLSRQHVRMFRRGERFFLEDMESTNGTFVNGEQITAPRQLNDGDRIQMGQTSLLRFNLHDAWEQEAFKRLYESAVRDPLTHVYNRRYLDERLEAEFAYSIRHGTPLSVALLDLDWFKRINDVHGHLAGDAVLQAVGSAIARVVRTEDLVARYGGEEFCLVARGIDAASGLSFAERVRRTVERLTVPWSAQDLKVTLSIGVATLSQEQAYASLDELLAAADEALYRAKQLGRNRSCSAQAAPNASK